MRSLIHGTWLLILATTLMMYGCAIDNSATGPTTSELSVAPTSTVPKILTTTATPTTEAATTTQTATITDDVTTTTSGTVTVPNVRALMSVASIEQVLSEVGLSPRFVPFEIPDREREDPDGFVALQEPEAGAELQRGSIVDVLLYASMPTIPAGEPSPGAWDHFDEGSGLASDCVTSIDVAKDGTIWIGCSGGLSTFDGEALTTVNDTLGVIEIVADNDGGVWVSSLNGDSGVVTLRQFSNGPAFDLQVGSAETDTPPVVPERFHGSEWTAIDGGPGWGVAISDAGVVWTSDPEDGLYRYDGEWSLLSRPPWMSEDDAPGIPAMGTDEIWTDGDGNLWAVTDGLSRFDGSNWETYLAGARVTDLAFAPDGTAWVATMWTGAYSFDGTGWSHYGIDDGLVSEELTSIAVGSDGSVWFGTAANGVVRFTPDR